MTSTPSALAFSSFEPAFTPNSAVVYVTTQFAGSINKYGYVLAICTRDLCPGAPCPADCDASGALDIGDFTCFQNAFALGDLAKADCDASGTLDIGDFTCFQNRFALGCP